jgi:predicted amino acid-binding ACT domain protein
MAQKIEKAEVWSGEIRDEVGGLAAVLSPLVLAGADFSFLIARRKPESPGTGVIFVGGIRGAKQKKAAQSVGLAPSDEIGGLRIKATDKPGLVNRVVSKLAAAGINLRGVSASVIGSKCQMILAFDGAADRDNAAKILKKKLQRSLPGG